MIDLDLFVAQATAAHLRLEKIRDHDHFKEVALSHSTFWVDGMQCCIWNDVLTAKAGIPPEYLPGACFVPDCKLIIVNEFIAYKSPRPVLEAIIQHELGHYKFAHYGSERIIEHEYQADKYSHDNGCDMIGALQYMVDIANNDLQHVVFAAMVEELEDRIKVLKALDK